MKEAGGAGFTVKRTSKPTRYSKYIWPKNEIDNQRSVRLFMLRISFNIELR